MFELATIGHHFIDHNITIDLIIIFSVRSMIIATLFGHWATDLTL